MADVQIPPPQYVEEALDDLEKLDNSARQRVVSAMLNTARMIVESGGKYGKPLGNQNSSCLANCRKVKVGNIRVVYRRIKKDNGMQVIVIGARADKKVYKEAQRRLKKLGATKP